MTQLLVRGRQGGAVQRLRRELARQLGDDARDFPHLERGDVLDRDKPPTALADRRIQATHGSFDDDIDTINQTLMHIMGSAPMAVLDDLRGF